MDNPNEVRIDKWLWAVRIFKTRSKATDACRKGRVIIDDVQVKPSRAAKKGDRVIVKRPPVVYTYEVKELTEKRLPAKLAVDFAGNLTPQQELDKIKVKKHTVFVRRDPGSGRPTKRERRIMDRMNPFK